MEVAENRYNQEKRLHEEVQATLEFERNKHSGLNIQLSKEQAAANLLQNDIAKLQAHVGKLTSQLEQERLKVRSMG